MKPNLRRLLLERLENRKLLAGLTYYVSPSHESASDSNPGTQELPLATYLPFVWAYGQSDPNIGRIQLEPGDNVVIGEGLIDAIFANEGHVNGLLLRDLHGTEENPIVIQGSPGAIIDARNPGETMPSIRISGSSNLIIEGLEVSGFGRGLRIEDSENIQVVGTFFNEVDGVDNENQAAIEVHSSSDVLVTQSLIVDSYDREAADTGGERTENSRAIVLFSNRGPVQIVDNVILNTPQRDADITGGGITIKHPGDDLVEINDNVLINVATTGIGASSALYAHHNLLIDSAALAVRNFGSQTVSHDDIQFSYNTIVNRVEAAGHHDWEGTAGGFSYTSDEGNPESVIGDVAFENNLVFDARSYNIDRAFLTLGAYRSDELFHQMVPGLTIDNNGYFNPNHAAQFNSFVGGGPIGGTYAFADWQLQGFDQNSVYANPGFDETSFFPSAQQFANTGIYGGEESRLAILIVDEDRKITEGEQTIATVTRSGANVDLSVPLTVQISATSSDVALPDSITIPAGENSATFSIAASSDSISERIEAVRFTVDAAGFDQTRGDWLRVVDSSEGSAPDEGNAPDDSLPGNDSATDDKPIVAINLEFVDGQGSQIEQAQIGDEIFLVAKVEDIRENPSGIFSVYFDAQWDPGLTDVDSQLIFDSAFSSLQNANLEIDGLLDEVGAVSGDLDGVIQGELFRLAMTVVDVGNLRVSTNPADQLPVHEISVLDVDVPVASQQVQYGSAEIEIVARSIQANDDHFVQFNDGQPIFFDVLNNDSANAQLISVDSATGGAATVQGDMVRFVPDVGFFGELGFSYQIGGPGNQTANAEVQLSLEKRWHNPGINTDVSDDGFTSPIDALQVLNFIGNFGVQELPSIPFGAQAQSGYVDVNADGQVTAIDALLVINSLTETNAAESEFVAEAVSQTETASLKVSSFLETNEIDQDEVSEDPRDYLFAESDEFRII